ASNSELNASRFTEMQKAHNVVKARCLELEAELSNLQQATNEAIIQDFDDIKARIEADRILAEKLQEQEREQFTIEERAKFLHDTIAAQRKFLAQQRSQAIRNKPPTKNQLRNQMITYLKHVGNFKHANLKGRKFEDIQALYEKIKRLNEHFISTGSAKDERLIKKMNEKRGGLSKSEVIKEDTKEEVKDEDKDEESTRKRKLGTRKKMKSRKRRYIQHTSEDDTDKENDELRLCLKIAQDEEKEVDYEILDRKYPIIDWKTECLGTKPQPDEAKSIEEINLNVVTRSNGQQRHFSVLTSVLSIFDREDLNAVYQLVMNKYQDEMPEGFERVLWGDLMVLFNPDEQDEFWSSQHEWKIISWKLHNSSGVHTLMTNEGVVIHMLTEKKYPLKKEILVLADLESEEQDLVEAKRIGSPQANRDWGKVSLKSVDGLLLPNIVETNGRRGYGKGHQNPLMALVIRKKRDNEFTEAENIKELADIQAINILTNGNESIHDYFVRFHKLINDMKITKIQILAHQRNTKFLNNLPSYQSKYVTIVKNSQDISNVSYVNLYTHLKSYEQHAMKTLSKMNQSSGNTDPLAYMAQATKTSSHTSSQQYSPSVLP
ncbi:hypothetical protein Tco_0959208, partial [Tanacetum coccineum]